MLKIEGKTFMNIQEAVQWLLDNNALPFQSSANYQANTEIGLGTIVNPSPAKVRIGSLIFFADSKVSTVVGITETGFICSDQYNNLVDDIAYVTNVSINASGHLITTLSDGQTIDAGIIKQVSGFSINASQHLIVSYNDGTTTDLGAIFSGNITVSGNLTVTGGISGNAITGNSIIENMTGYSFLHGGSYTDTGITLIYAGASKTGNKLTLVVFFSYKDAIATPISTAKKLGTFEVPGAVDDNVFPFRFEGGSTDYIDVKSVSLFGNVGGSLTSYSASMRAYKTQAQRYVVGLIANEEIPANTEVFGRYEITILLSENLAS